jgi:radical SAM family uncharacterized protein/radical SAM-linked protein
VGVNTSIEGAYDELLPLVEKPGRYLGGERGTYRKDPATVAVHVALAFPDVYEIGQSHLGLQILYDVLNRQHDVAAERVYAPWVDMEALLRRRGIPLVSLETRRPLDAFHIVGFSLQYELTYTNLLTMLELGRIPLHVAERTPAHPLVLAGGPGAFNPEPIAEFIDAFVLGDGEDAILDVCAAYRAWDGCDRMALLEALSHVRGVYIPALFEPRYHAEGTVASIEPLRPAQRLVERRILPDLNNSAVPRRPLVPNIDIVHGRPSVEVMRGCVKGCRFCQAGYVYRPQRERDPRTVVAEATRLVEETGYEELSLLSLSTGDYSCVNPLLRDLMNRFAPQRVAISLPSTRIDAISPHVLDELSRGRKTGFTLAPEAGSQRMRNIIQKEYKEEELVEAARRIFALGWRNLKLYFMIGLPGETEADLLGIVNLCRKVAGVGPGRPEVTASISTFVPKPHTPFQWAAQLDIQETQARQGLLRRELGRHGIRFKWHDARLSHLEGIFARGDRRLGRLVRTAQQLGCRFDGWTDRCRWDLWQQALAECDMEPAFYLRRRPLGETLPWEHLHSGVTREYLRQELARAVEGILTPDCCLERCTYCGACDFKAVRNVSYHLRGAKGGTHQGTHIDRWAREHLPEAPVWGTKSWQEAAQRLADRAARAARTRGATPPEETLDAIAVSGARDMPSAARRYGLRGRGSAQECGAPAPALHGTRNGQGSRTRVRLCYTKRGPARFIGTRELAELFYRAARRAALPVTFSNGHHPLPRLSFGPAVPVGVTSDGELMDMELCDDVEPGAVAAALDLELPDGLRVIGAWAEPLDGRRIEPAIRGFRYVVQLPEEWADVRRLTERVAAFDQARSFPVCKRGKRGATKTVDVRATTTIEVGGPGHLQLEVRCDTQGSAPPAAIVGTLLALDDDATRQLRITKVATLFRGDPEPVLPGAARTAAG